MNSFHSAGDPHGDFQLHASTGALSTARSLDRETRSEYTLEVVAMDRGSPALSATVTVEVKVLDVNDNSPVFGKNSYSVEVSEDAAEGTQVLEVSRHWNEESQGSRGHYIFLVYQMCCCFRGVNLILNDLSSVSRCQPQMPMMT